MSLKKKIIVSFIISAAVIAVLAGYEYVNVASIKNEIRFLELTDTVRTKSLQLRRHEKNFFLYGPGRSAEESGAIHRYLDELDASLAVVADGERQAPIRSLGERVRSYRRGFDAIEVRLGELARELHALYRGHARYAQFFPLIEAALYERPLQAAGSIGAVFHLSPSHHLITGLKELDREIIDLRKTGEDMIAISRDLDNMARQNVESSLRSTQTAILVVFPLFLLSGIGMLFFITRNIVGRLGLLIDVVERTGKGAFPHVEVPERQWGNDEVGVLIRKFDHMVDELANREAVIARKNRELVQTKKLAAIGTLAAGVAHELNNPLNNIYLSTQVLARELGDSAPAAVREVTGDILGQTVRVKKIVGDLLEFARGREPQVREMELNAVLSGAFARVQATRGAQNVRFDLETDPAGVRLLADPEQLEQVFINLFANALDAIGPAEGRIVASVEATADAVRVRVTDSGRGIPPASLEKVFEPFYTTRDKGTGLGLAIVFNIINKHYGEISVESEVGKGTTFTITLPRLAEEEGTTDAHREERHRKHERE